MFSLENASFFLSVDPQRNLFSVAPRQKNAPSLKDVHFSVRYRRGGTWYQLEENLQASVDAPSDEASIHGELRTRMVRFGPNRHGLTIEMTFALPRALPLLFWRMKIRHTGNRPVSLGRIELLRVGFISASQARPRRNGPGYPRGDYVFPLKGAVPAFFSNGWGSWNYTGTMGFTEHFHRTRFGWFNGPMRVNPGTPQPRADGRFASDMFGVLGDRANRGGLLLGFLSQKEHFGSLEVLTNPLSRALSLWANGDETQLEPGGEMVTDWACLQSVHLDVADALGPYLDAVARENGLPAEVDAEIPVGWCSWYEYFQHISAEVIRMNLAQAARFSDQVNLDLIQVDDGWQAQIGDWDRFSPAFPNGAAPLAQQIRSEGFKPGLWLAPFILHPRSRLAADQPDWILRNRLGLPVNAGFVWNTFTRALDISRPEVLAHAVNVVRRASEDWGNTYLKLDFLYAGALGGRRADRTRSRAKILRNAFEEIRKAVGPEITLLGCGCPLGPAIGLFDAMRINADVAPYWFPRFLGHERIFRREPDFPSARNAIQNALTRAPLHRRWWVNDPDCLLIRPDSDLSPAEVRSLATVIALTGGSVLLSDDLTKLPPERLKMAQQLLPPIGKRPEIQDWFDSAMPARVRIDLEGAAGRWHLLVRFNWTDRPADLSIDLQDFQLDPSRSYALREFWTGEVRTVEGEATLFTGIAPHGCVLAAVRPISGAPMYVGSELHVSQGLEVTGWEPFQHGVRLTFGIAPGRDGCIVLRLPEKPAGEGIEDLGDGFYVFRVNLRLESRFEIRYA